MTNYIKCETDKRINVPRDKDGRVHPNDVTVVNFKMMLPKGTDVEEFCNKLYDDHPEIMAWYTNHTKK